MRETLLFSIFMPSCFILSIYFLFFRVFLAKFFQTNLFSLILLVQLLVPTLYLFLPKKSCMSILHSSSNTPDVTVVLGCRALGANLE